MEIYFHGGKCCAIKTIANLNYTPTFSFSPREKTKKVTHRDRQGSHVSTGEPFYWQERPRETGAQRFDAYLDYLRRVRPYGIVEVTIVTSFGGAAIRGFDPCEAEDGVEMHGLESFCVETPENEDLLPSYQESWEPFLQERGFRLVTVAPNSNSGNFVKVYHLVMDPEWHGKVKDNNMKFDIN